VYNMADQKKQPTSYPLTYWLALYLANGAGHIPVHMVRLMLYKRAFKVKIGKRSVIHLGCRFSKPSGIQIGDNTVVGERVYLDGRKSLRIGDNVSIASEARLCTKEYKIDCPRVYEAGAPVVIKDRVHIGSRAIVLPGVTIGEGAAVLPGSVVKEDVKPWTVVEGVPAKYVADRKVYEYEPIPRIRSFFQ
jgi:acetyltransferase-like isoleucine patch superfamily enzyme